MTERQTDRTLYDRFKDFQGSHDSAGASPVPLVTLSCYTGGPLRQGSGLPVRPGLDEVVQGLPMFR